MGPYDLKTYGMGTYGLGPYGLGPYGFGPYGFGTYGPWFTHSIPGNLLHAGTAQSCLGSFAARVSLCFQQHGA